MESYEVKEISIQARSPGINPIEIFFIHIKQVTVGCDRRNITHKTFEQFFEPIKTTITSYPVRENDIIIESMQKRMKMIAKNKGERLKY